MSDYLDRIKKIMELKSRDEALEVMEESLKKGLNMWSETATANIFLFSLKPKNIWTWVHGDMLMKMHKVHCPQL